MKIALFPGSFDPFTIGHEDIVLKSLNLYDKVIIAVGENMNKHCLFDVDSRVSMISDCFLNQPRVEVRSYSGLTVDFCHKVGANFIVRGLRNSLDFQYESDIAAANRMVAPDVETVFFLCDASHQSISSSLVRELLHHGHEVKSLLPKAIHDVIARH